MGRLLNIRKDGHATQTEIKLLYLLSLQPRQCQHLKRNSSMHSRMVACWPTICMLYGHDNEALRTNVHQVEVVQSGKGKCRRHSSLKGSGSNGSQGLSSSTHSFCAQLPLVVMPFNRWQFGSGPTADASSVHMLL